MKHDPKNKNRWAYNMLKSLVNSTLIRYRNSNISTSHRDCLDWFTVLFKHMLLWSVCVSLGISCLCFHIILLLSFSHHQGQKVATCLFIICPRSLETLSSCKCSYLSATSSLPKYLWTEQLIRANVLVSQKLIEMGGKKEEEEEEINKKILCNEESHTVAVFGTLLMPLVSSLQLLFAFAFIPSVCPNQGAINIFKVVLHAAAQGGRGGKLRSNAPWFHHIIRK